MTAQNFMNVVRFKLKSDCVDKYFEVIDKTSFEGMTQRYIAKTGDNNYCFVGTVSYTHLTLPTNREV